MEHVLQDLEARTFFAIVVFAFMNPSDTKNGNDLVGKGQKVLQ